MIERYANDLVCSLSEFKTCRIAADIPFDKFNVEYCILDKKGINNIADLFDNAGCNYEYVIKHYTAKQRDFIKNIQWLKI